MLGGQPAQGVFGAIGIVRGHRVHAGRHRPRPISIVPGGDYQSSPVASGDPMECALACERDRRCRSWSFAYPTEIAGSAMCWLKNSVPARVPDNSSISGVRGAGVVEPHNRGGRNLDRSGRRRLSKFRSQERRGDEACRLACTAENKCRAWTLFAPWLCRARTLTAS